MSEKLLVARLGTVDYGAAWNLQRRLATARRQDIIPDTLLLLEHPHTYTLGRRSRPEHVLLSRDELQRAGIPLYEVDRGGDVTYHGPGQLVGYPILRRSGARIDYLAYMRQVEHALLVAVRALGLPGETKERLSGVWVRDRKVCAIGVKIDAYGITSHGFALNVNVDLAYFDHIVPCGIRDKGVTSLERECGRKVSIAAAMHAVIASIEETFQVSVAPRPISLNRLESLASAV